MQPAAQVQAAIELLSECLERRVPADRLMSSYFRQRRYIGSKDKAAISEYFYSTIRHQSVLSFLLQQSSLEVTPAHLVATQLHLDGQNLGDVFTGHRHQPARLNSLSDIAQIDKERLNDAPEHVQLGVPAWLEEPLKHSLGEYYPSEMKALQQRATTDLRVNTLKGSRADTMLEFQEQGIECEVGYLSPWSIQLKQRLALNNLPAFKQGLVEVQDEGSQLLALSTGAKAGETVVDFCAGAGGKTLAMAAMMQNRGALYACDVHTRRLDNLGKRARRAGVHNLRTHVLSSEHDKWVKKHQGRADLVLIDAPCSGTGTWRRNPDSRWNLTQDDLSNLEQTQESILDSASRLVKPGGRLIYATCSLLGQENQAQSDRFLQQHREFVQIDFSEHLTEFPVESGSSLRLLTGQHGTDGFFAAGFRRAVE